VVIQAEVGGQFGQGQVEHGGRVVQREPDVAETRTFEVILQ
jgi:hypothetical protein